jgi:hypothetical protein
MIKRRLGAMVAAMVLGAAVVTVPAGPAFAVDYGVSVSSGYGPFSSSTDCGAWKTVPDTSSKVKARACAWHSWLGSNDTGIVRTGVVLQNTGTVTYYVRANWDRMEVTGFPSGGFSQPQVVGSANMLANYPLGAGKTVAFWLERSGVRETLQGGGCPATDDCSFFKYATRAFAVEQTDETTTGYIYSPVQSVGNPCYDGPQVPSWPEISGMCG